jgi:copper chaperone CopZ
MPNVKHQATAFFKLRGEADQGRSTRLKQALGALDGVIRVEVNFILDVVSVDYDPDKLLLDDIREKVDASNLVLSGTKPRSSRRRPAGRTTVDGSQS